MNLLIAAHSDLPTEFSEDTTSFVGIAVSRVSPSRLGPPKVVQNYLLRRLAGVRLRCAAEQQPLGALGRTKWKTALLDSIQDIR